MKPTLTDLQSLARAAGEILREHFHQHNHIQLKGEINLVTEADQRSEAYLLQEITARFPDHEIIAEESGKIMGDPEHCWYIDPLDGTTNFAHGLPIFSVSLAYAFQSQLTLGVVYNPISDELFAAEKGKGATLNGKPIEVARRAELAKSLVVTGFPYDRFTNPVNNLNYFNKFVLRVQGIRRLGSAALDLCYVAAGWLDGYWELHTEPWDLAAGAVIASEAGAKVSRMDGQADFLRRPCTIVAANPDLHALMLEVIRQTE